MALIVKRMGSRLEPGLHRVDKVRLPRCGFNLGKGLDRGCILKNEDGALGAVPSLDGCDELLSFFALKLELICEPL